MRYEQYITSKAWFAIRECLLDEHNNKCSFCGRKYELHVHHLNYDCLGKETPEDVLVLCVRCHDDLHTALRKYPATEKAIKQYQEVTLEEFADRWMEFSVIER
jgi:5-methylcytosine-specific restriction endonuclease McrA